MSEEPIKQEGETPAAPPTQTYHIKSADGTIYGAANGLAEACSLAGSAFVAAVNYSPSLTVVHKDTGVIEAIIGRPEAQPQQLPADPPAPEQHTEEDA